MSFIPKSGKFCLLSAKRLKKVNTVSFPKKLRFALIELNRGEANLFIGNFLDGLERDNKVFRWTIGNENEPLEELKNRLRKVNPDGVIIPGGDYPSPFSQRIDQISAETMKVLSRETGSDKIGIRYFSPVLDILPGELYYFFTERGMAVKQRAMSAHYSQIERTPFDKVANSSDRINAILAEELINCMEFQSEPERFAGHCGKGLQTLISTSGDVSHSARLSASLIYNKGVNSKRRWKYAEKYYISRVDEKGDFYPCEFKTQALFENDRASAVERFFGKEPIRTLFASPHPDDDVIASGGLLHWLIKIAEERKNGSTLNSLVFTAAHRTKIPSSVFAERGNLTKEEWIVYKENEAEEAIRRLGGNHCKVDIQFLRLPFYDTMKEEKPDIRVISEKERERVYRKFKEINPNLAIIPHPDDLHPDHRATWQLSKEALARIAREERKPIVVLYYLSPWSIRTNLFYYHPAKRKINNRISEIIDLSEEVMAIVGSELCTGFGQKPPSSEELGGERAEAIYVYSLSPLAGER